MYQSVLLLRFGPQTRHIPSQPQRVTKADALGNCELGRHFLASPARKEQSPFKVQGACSP